MDLKGFRNQLDMIDKKIIEAIAQRFLIIKKIAEYKKKNNIPRYDLKREQEIAVKIKKMAEKEKINISFINKIFEILLQESHQVQKDFLNEDTEV